METELSPAVLEELARIEASIFGGEAWSAHAFAQIAALPDTRVILVRAEDAKADTPKRQQETAVHETPMAEGGQVLGYLVANLSRPDSEILNVAVRAEVRGGGLGSKLVTCALHAARERGCTHMFLEVRASNLAAQALYAKHGFEEIGQRRGYYSHPRENALVMRKRLVAPAPGVIGSEFLKLPR